MTDVVTPHLTPASLEDHRGALRGHCYRMLGSPFEAEDAVQETLVRAWRALDRFEGRASLRSWLIGIATNVCIDMLHAAKRRALPMDVGSPSSSQAPFGPPLPERTWVGPMVDAAVDPADVTVAREDIRLAFVAALQHLGPKQRAVLILRDILRWKADEVADLLGGSATAVHSTLRRARAALADAQADQVAEPTDDAARALVNRYVEAFERFDIDALVTLLHEDVVLSMPPFAFWLRGRAAVRQWFGRDDGDCQSIRYRPIDVNGGPGLAMYRPTGPGNTFQPFGVQVVDVSGGRIIGMHAFLDPGLFHLFDLPPTLD